MTDRGAELFETVVSYCDLGDHQSGTDVDHATIEWFAAELERRGASGVERLSYEFPRYDARWEVTFDGEPVRSIPVFYEGYGRVVTDDPVRCSVPVGRGTLIDGLRPVAQAAISEGREAAVMATLHDPSMARGTYNDPGKLLFAPNRWPDRPGSGLPTICVAGELGARFGEAKIRVEIDAQLVTGTSANVLARFGDGPDDQRILLSTPLSGWFRVAGERGTGIAVLLAVAEEVAKEHPVLVLGTNGHELMGAGLKHYERTGPVTSKGIFHFGASVASGNSDGSTAPISRSPGVVAQGWVGADRRDALAEALAPFGDHVRLHDRLPAKGDDPGVAGWIGESTLWAMHGRPVVSIAGGFPLHHAPEDVPELATSPALLAESYDVALQAARVLSTVTV